MSGPIKISAHWVAQVLRDRGIRPPAILTIQQFLVPLTDLELRELYAGLRKVEQGVDDPSVTRAIVERIQAHVTQVEPGQGAGPQRLPSEPAVPANATALSKPAKAPSATAAPWYRGKGAHIYSTSAAMKVEIDVLKSDPDEPLCYTVQVEAAQSKGTRSYDWDNKLVFQFTKRELPLLAAMLMGYLNQPLTLSNHGPDRDKSLEIRSDGTNRLLVRLRQASRHILIPVFAEDLHAWLTITMQALKQNAPELDGTLILEMLKRTASIHGSADQSRADRQGAR
jgi:hypothetical protein